MKKTIFSMFFIFLLGVLTVSAQESCNCSSEAGGCTAGQSCSAGNIAVCSCTSSGCVSYCQAKGGGELPEFSSYMPALQTRKASEYGNVLSSAFHKTIVFQPANPDFQISADKFNFTKANDWDVFGYLAANGKLTINGHDVKFWNEIRKSFSDNAVKGNEIKFCLGMATPQEYLNELSFITGKRFSVISGNATEKLINPISGSNLTELLQNLGKAGQITIKQN